MIRELGRSLSNAVLETAGRASSRVQRRRPLPADLLESDDAYLAVFDAPGATSSDVQVRLDDRRIQVRVDRFREFHEGFEMRFPGRGLALDGSVRLPEEAVVDAEGATATLTSTGTLRVRVPKAEPSGEPIEIAGEEAEEGDEVEGETAEAADETSEE